VYRVRITGNSSSLHPCMWQSYTSPRIQMLSPSDDLPFLGFFRIVIQVIMKFIQPAKYLYLMMLMAALGLPLMAQANVQGQWTTMSRTMPINPIHVSLLNNGQVLVVD